MIVSTTITNVEVTGNTVFFTAYIQFVDMDINITTEGTWTFSWEFRSKTIDGVQRAIRVPRIKDDRDIPASYKSQFGNAICRSIATKIQNWIENEKDQVH